MADAWTRVEKAWKIYEPLPQSKEEALWKQFVPTWKAWKKDSQSFDELIKTGKRDEALTLVQGRMRESFSKAEKLLNNVNDLNLKIAKEDGNVAESKASFAKYLSLAAVIIGTMLSLALGIIFSISITRPINRVITGLAEGSDQVAAAASQNPQQVSILLKGHPNRPHHWKRPLHPWKKCLP